MYSPWRVKPAVARAYGVPLDMSDALRARIEGMREDYLSERKAMIKRAHEGDDVAVEGGKQPAKKKHKKMPEEETEAKGKKGDKAAAAAVNKGGRPKGSKNKVSQEKQAEEERLRAELEQREREAAQAEEEKKKRKKPTKFPAEGGSPRFAQSGWADGWADLLVELNEKEKTAGKPLQKPELSKRLPFPGTFEVFLETWNFLNAMS
jgi:bromodomain adjacent to zinc finger domain protein 1A